MDSIRFPETGPAPRAPRAGLRVLICCLALGALWLSTAGHAAAAAAPSAILPSTSRESIYEPLVPDPLVQEMIDLVSGDRVYNTVAELSGAAPAMVGGAPYTFQTRSTTSGTAINNATQYAYERLVALGYAVGYAPWSKWGYSGRNVIAELPGQRNPGRIYTLGAHLDSYAIGGSAPGADDNATGSAAALMAAEILGRYYWDCTLRVGLWTGEEQGLLGSDVYAAALKTSGADVRGYLNLDMLGWDAQRPRRLDLFATTAVSGSVAIADLVIDVIAAYSLDLIATKYVNDPLFQQSDNYSFSKQGYPSILLIEDYRGYANPFIHTANDTVAQIDPAYLADMVRTAVGAFATLTGCLIADPATTTEAALIGSSHTEVNLAWYQTYPNASFEILRDDLPYFDPDSAPLIGVRTAPKLGEKVSYTDADATGDPSANRFYMVRGRDASGVVASASQRLGAITFALSPGREP